MRNAFGAELYEIKDLFSDEVVEGYVRETLQSVLGHLDISSSTIVDRCIELAKGYDSITEYERSAHGILAGEGVTERIPEKLSGRANIIFNQISPYLTEESVLDLGCGDGDVGAKIAAEGYRVILTDVYRHRNIESTGLEFRLFRQGEDVPLEDNEVDNTLLLTVLHHSDDPVKTLQEARRVTRDGGIVLVLESVYGVDSSHVTDAEAYAELTTEQQRKVNIFFDHFYNRVIHFSEDPETKVNVPFNFNTPEGWKETFEANGFEQEDVIHLGIDQPTVPEYHTLHVLRVKK